MKRWTLLILTLLAAAPGCVELDVWLREKQAAETPPPAAPAPRPRTLVKPGDVTEQTSRETMDALRHELDRAETDKRN